MKILVLNYEFPPLGGGAANAAYHLMREFARTSDLSFEVVTSSTGARSVELFSPNIRVHFLDIGKKGDLHFQTYRDLITYSWKSFRYSKSLLSHEKCDLCHAFFGIPCGYIASRLRLPYIVSLRGSDVPFFNERFRIADRLLFKRMSVKVWRKARRVVANSEGLRELARRTSPGQAIDLVPNGVDADTFAPLYKGGSRGDSSPAGTLPIPPTPLEPTGATVRVICVARLIRRKRIDVLIRAMAQLRGKNVSLHLAGTGNEEGNLKDLAREMGVEDRVHFEGYVDHDRIPAFYQSGDMFVLPSVNEGMSNTVLEAMACGLPVLMNDTGGASELLEEGVNGFLLGKDDVSDVVEKISRYLDSPELRRRHGCEARKKAEGLSWRSVADQYAEIYREVASTFGEES